MCSSLLLIYLSLFSFTLSYMLPLVSCLDLMFFVKLATWSAVSSLVSAQTLNRDKLLGIIKSQEGNIEAAVATFLTDDAVAKIVNGKGNQRFEMDLWGYVLGAELSVRDPVGFGQLSMDVREFSVDTTDISAEVDVDASVKWDKVDTGASASMLFFAGPARMGADVDVHVRCIRDS